MTPYISIYVSCENSEQAQSLLNPLLEKKWVACGQIVNSMQSFYLWQGLIQESREALLILKTKKIFFAEIKEFIVQKHTYEVAEIIAHPITQGHADYLDWIEDSLSTETN